MSQSAEKVCYLIGSSLSHSLSPGIHEIIYRRLGLNWQYLLREVESPEDLESFTEEIKNSPECAGFNVTIPYKTNIIKFLEDTDKAAARIGAVNTVLRREGKLKGANTDWQGLCGDLKESLGYRGTSKQALILGAGGAARAAIFALIAGFSIKPQQLYLYDIRRQRAEKLKADFKDFPLMVVENFRHLNKILTSAHILINATPVGMKPSSPPVELQGTKTKESMMVYDLVYNRKTELLKQAENKGLRCASGAGMLARQGAGAFQMWSGIQVPESVKAEMTEYVKNTAQSA